MSCHATGESHLATHGWTHGYPQPRLVSTAGATMCVTARHAMRQPWEPAGSTWDAPLLLVRHTSPLMSHVSHIQASRSHSRSSSESGPSDSAPRAVGLFVV